MSIINIGRIESKMIIYLFLYFLLLIGAYISERSIFVLYLILAIMSFMIGFRGAEVGTDTMSYQMLYDNLGRDGYLGYPEPLFGLLCVGFNLIGLSFQSSQTILIFISLCMTAHVIKYYSPNYCLSMFMMISLYFLFYSMNIYREMVACFIMVYGLNILFNEDLRWTKTKFIFVLLIAATIHKASLFLLPVMFVRKWNLSEMIIYFGIISSILIGVMDLGGAVFSKLGLYEKDLAEYMRSGGRVVLALFLSLYWIIAFLYIYKKSDEVFKRSMYTKLFFYGIIINNLLVRQDMGLRLMLYFTIPLVIGIPLFVSRTDNPLKTQAIVISYSSLYFFVFLMANSADVVPYSLNW